jgi:hypothetical protein
VPLVPAGQPSRGWRSTAQRSRIARHSGSRAEPTVEPS